MWHNMDLKWWRTEVLSARNELAMNFWSIQLDDFGPEVGKEKHSGTMKPGVMFNYMTHGP